MFASCAVDTLLYSGRAVTKPPVLIRLPTDAALQYTGRKNNQNGGLLFSHCCPTGSLTGIPSGRGGGVQGGGAKIHIRVLPEFASRLNDINILEPWPLYLAVQVEERQRQGMVIPPPPPPEGDNQLLCFKILCPAGFS